jgi:hypothetical protein
MCEKMGSQKQLHVRAQAQCMLARAQKRDLKFEVYGQEQQFMKEI